MKYSFVYIARIPVKMISLVFLRVYFLKCGAFSITNNRGSQNLEKYAHQGHAINLVKRVKNTYSLYIYIYIY